MKDNIISFHQPESRWLMKAHTARKNGDVEKAVQLYRTAVEQNPSDWDIGLTYALYLWEISCWYTSQRECLRLLALAPNNDKIYGLLYRNYLCMGQDENARFAYEKYMMHRYHHPDGGLNLNEENPPMPDAPPKRRFKHLLLRAARLMDAGDYDRANHLLVHANHPTFPAHSVLRDMLEVQLMTKTGLTDEAKEIVYGMLDEAVLSGSEAIALMPMMCELDDPQFAGKLLLYAASVAQNPIEVHDVTATALSIDQPHLAMSMLENLLSLEPYRLDVLYQMAVCHLHMDQMDEALHTIQLCHRLDPCDADVDYLYRLLTDAAHTGATCQDTLKLPIPLFGGSVSFGRTILQMHLKELLTDNAPEDAANLLCQWPEQSRIMDGLSHMTNELVFSLMEAVCFMKDDQQEAFLRRMLLCGNLDSDEEDEVFMMLSELGVTGLIPLLRNSHLKERMLEETPMDEPDLDDETDLY